MANEEVFYNERYCAFVDILGFRQLIERLSQEDNQFLALRELLRRVHTAHTNRNSEKSETDFRAQSISDAVCISTRATSLGLVEIFESLEALTLDLLVEGFFVRGGVVRAPLYHDDKMVFGEALVRAFRFESEIANFPRIVVSREVREDILKYTGDLTSKWRGPTMEWLRPSADGPMYLDVLKPVLKLIRKRNHPYEKLTPEEEVDCQRFVQIKEKIQQRYEEAMDTPHNFEKVRWFARYWNETIPGQYLLTIRDAERPF